MWGFLSLFYPEKRFSSFDNFHPRLVFSSYLPFLLPFILSRILPYTSTTKMLFRLAFWLLAFLLSSPAAIFALPTPPTDLFETDLPAAFTRKGIVRGPPLGIEGPGATEYYFERFGSFWGRIYDFRPGQDKDPYAVVLNLGVCFPFNWLFVA